MQVNKLVNKLNGYMPLNNPKKNNEPNHYVNKLKYRKLISDYKINIPINFFTGKKRLICGVFRK